MNYNPGLNAGERASSLFQPDTLLPNQYFDTFRRKSHLDPEKRLVLAVLEDAITCFQKTILAKDEKGKGLFRETEEWLMEEDIHWLFSFNNICDVMGFSPDYVRHGLLRWKESKLTKRPPAKIYRLASRRENRKSGHAVRPRTGQRLRKAAGR